MKLGYKSLEGTKVQVKRETEYSLLCLCWGYFHVTDKVENDFWSTSLVICFGKLSPNSLALVSFPDNYLHISAYLRHCLPDKKVHSIMCEV